MPTESTGVWPRASTSWPTRFWRRSCSAASDGSCVPSFPDPPELRGMIREAVETAQAPVQACLDALESDASCCPHPGIDRRARRDERHRMGRSNGHAVVHLLHRAGGIDEANAGGVKPKKSGGETTSRKSWSDIRAGDRNAAMAPNRRRMGLFTRPPGASCATGRLCPRRSLSALSPT